ncbi:LysR family transcriptional regulator [Ahrensia marina]|uniref:LysR family transcriptional regulator n=1 Tax=Ahrensia marina TaxID=1514904 RepID=A0A0M9GNX6_9HYPH|nr:LysR family transcriptional regulator [Ahrensia marina]KPB02347.1 LysR family transcriptional regulator [Ahrensia marina]
MNWDDGRLFLAIARAEQMLAASKALGINQATLSRRMAGFEKSLGVSLLIRRTNGCQLTPEGEKLLRALEIVEAGYLQAQAELKVDSPQVSGTLRIGTPDGFGVSFLAPRIDGLIRNHPQLNVQLVPVPRMFSLSQREADIAIVIGQPKTGRLIAQKLTDYSLSLYASADYLSAYSMPENQADLSNHRLIGYVSDLVYSPELAFETEFFSKWKSSLEISSATGQMEAVRAGAGIGILHDYLAAGNDSLIPVLPELRVTRSYWMAHHEDLHGIARIKAGTDFLRSQIERSAIPFERPIN